MVLKLHPGNMFLVLLSLLLAHSPTALTFLIGNTQTSPFTGPGFREEGHFRYAAVASNTHICSQVGTEIMAKNGGSAADAAIATLLCVGMARFHSSGLGGDSVWTLYHKQTGKAYSIISRSTAPLASNSTMYANIPNGTVEGGISVAVPGEVMGYWEAHKLMGKLPWKDLFQPTIKLAQEGFPCEQSAADAIKSKISSGIFDRMPLLKQLVTNPVTNTWYKAGETVRLPLLAKTLIRLAEGGAPEFYNGSLADEMVEEIQGAGGIITKDDFKSYFADVTEPLNLKLHGNLKIFTPGLPSGGPVLLYILNILSGYNMTYNDISTNNRTVLTYHRILEAFKHAYAARSEMGSPYGETPDFIEEMKQLVENITSPEQGEEIRARISDSMTFPWRSYNPSFIVQEDHGTSHLAVLGPNGDAVSVTSTINLFFGSKVVGPKTGIIFNDMMDDFSVPGVVNDFLVQPSPANFIKPTKRPLSSMSPSIVINKDGVPVLVVGCAGGTKIISTTSFLTAMTLWLDEGIKSAIDAPRIHHQLYPDEAIISNAPQWLTDGLRQKGHKVSEVQGSISTPTGILQRVPGAVTANGENSVVDGY